MTGISDMLKKNPYISPTMRKKLARQARTVTAKPGEDLRNLSPAELLKRSKPAK